MVSPGQLKPQMAMPRNGWRGPKVLSMAFPKTNFIGHQKHSLYVQCGGIDVRAKNKSLSAPLSATLNDLKNYGTTYCKG